MMHVAHDMSIQAMNASDLDFAAHCTETEGWSSETRAEFEGFYEHDPGGCLVAKIGDQSVGIGIATSYRGFGFVGEIIVIAEERGKGIGRMILENAVSYLRAKNCRSIYLDGVLKAVPLYERTGFKKICRSLRFYGQIEGRAHAGIRPMRESDLRSVCGMDMSAFGTDRSFFLKRRFQIYPELCKVAEQEGKCTGFIFGRRGKGLVSFGPWLAIPAAESPLDLLETASLEALGTRIGLGVLEANINAAQAVRSLGLVEREDPPWRMVLGGSDRLGQSNSLYAIGSAAAG
jgi:ribosomal protein S18 acetylase RimI-like enzyme